MKKIPGMPQAWGVCKVREIVAPQRMVRPVVASAMLEQVEGPELSVLPALPAVHWGQ